jgi:hypothetical protein
MREDRFSQGLASAIYGTVLSTALIAAYSEDPDSDPLQVAVAVLSAAVVFWLAHAYAGILARGAQPGRVMARAGTELAQEWPLVLGALPPVLPLLLGPLALLSDYHAETAAIATGVAVLAGWGMAIAWRRGSGLLGVALGAGASAFFGLVVVALKAVVH